MTRGLAVLALLWMSLPAAAWTLPPLDKALNYRPVQPLVVLTSDGVEIAAFGAERRQFLPIARIPTLLQQAVLAVEDARFYEHAGVDPKGMARAALAMLTGGMRQGASTITQQVARTFFLSHEFTAERKAREIMIALELEKQLSKDRILELYLNEIYLGQRAYGFAAASQTYFGKPLDRLSIAETAMLAGLPQNPNHANPVSNLQRAVQRQRVVLERMRVTGVITEAQHRAARAEVLKIRSPGEGVLHAPHVAEMARQQVVERWGPEAYQRGIRVVTSLRADEQRAAWTALRRGLLAHDRRGPWRGVEGQAATAEALKAFRDDETLRLAWVRSASPRAVTLQLAAGETVTLQGEALRWVRAGLQPGARAPLAITPGAVVRLVKEGRGWAFAQWPQAEGALVALDPATGRVRALVGGFAFARQPFNHATQAWRQPGSAFKPLLYSAALETGVMPETLLDDAPWSAADGWTPKNSDGRFDGLMSLSDALARSRNLASVQVLQHVGVPAARDWVARLGLDPARQPADLTLALGSGAATPLQLAQAYAVFANGGHRVTPVLVERVEDASGRVLFEAPRAAPPGEAQRVIPARNAFLTAQMLGAVTRHGTAARAQAQLGRDDLHGKTGTTDDAVDAWFAGFQPTRVAVVWLGHPEPRSLGEGESGGGLALPVWLDYMAAALKGQPVVPLAPPPGLMQVDGAWRYEEFAAGGHVRAIGRDGAAWQPAPALAPEPAASAASAAASAPAAAD